MLSIVVPAYNEQDLVGELLRLLIALPLDFGLQKEILVVNDGSSDGTRDAIVAVMMAHPDAPLRLLDHAVNQGKGAAVRTGINAATGNMVIVQDADLEYNPSDINVVVAPIVRGIVEVVYGSRILKERAQKQLGVTTLLSGKHPHSYIFAYLGGVMITEWVNLLTGAKLTDEPTCYKCFHRRALDRLSIDCNDFSWEPEVTMKWLCQGGEIAEVPIDYRPRKRHQGKKINWRHGVQALWVVWRYWRICRSGLRSDKIRTRT